ncbi:MAG: tetratricopeptide repeat protein [Verrucomicrobiota bacterium]
MKPWIGLLTLHCLLSFSIADTKTLYSNALSFYKSGQLEEALETVDKLLEESEAYAPGRELKGRIYTAQDKLDLALEQFDKAIALDSKRASIHFYVGEVFFIQERWSEAYGAYRYAIEVDSEYRKPILKLIYCLIIMENYPRAHKWVTALNPTDELKPDYYFARAAMALATGTLDNYINALRQARTIYGTDTFNRYEPDLLRTTQWIKKRQKERETTSPQTS